MLTQKLFRQTFVWPAAWLKDRDLNHGQRYCLQRLLAKQRHEKLLSSLKACTQRWTWTELNWTARCHCSSAHFSSVYFPRSVRALRSRGRSYIRAYCPTYSRIILLSIYVCLRWLNDITCFLVWWYYCAYIDCCYDFHVQRAFDTCFNKGNLLTYLLHVHGYGRRLCR